MFVKLIRSKVDQATLTNHINVQLFIVS